MLKIASLLLAAALLALSGCGTPAAPADRGTEIPQMQEQLPFPLPSSLCVKADGKSLECFSLDDTDFVRADDFAAATGAVWETEGETCRISHGGMTMSLVPPIGARLEDGVWYLPLRQTASMLGMVCDEDEECDEIYYYTAPQSADVPEGYPVPVLMYHAMSDEIWGEEDLFVSPSEFEKQLQYLQENGFTTIFVTDLPNVAEYEKPVILTFDDGYEDNYTEMFPILKKYGAKATIFVVSDHFGRFHKMTRAQAAEMSASGLCSIQSHTLTHVRMDRLTAEEAEQQLALSKLQIAEVTGSLPTVFCYPEGGLLPETLPIVARHYDYALKMNGKCFHTGEDPLLISRYFVARETTLEEFAEMVSGKT